MRRLIAWTIVASLGCRWPFRARREDTIVLNEDARRESLL